MDEPNDLDELLRAVASRHRRRILSEAWHSERGSGELTEALGLAAASVSEHLKVLRKTGLVTMRSDGTYRLYRADREALARLAGMLADFPNPSPAAPSDDGAHGETPPPDRKHP